MNEHQGILILAEQRREEIHPVSYELLGKGRELADKLGCQISAVLLSNNKIIKAEELIYHGADRVFLYQHSSLQKFDVRNYKHNIVKLIKEIKPAIFLIGATHFGRSLGPRIAAALNTGLTADCIGLELDESGNLIQIRPAFTGNILAEIKTRTRPQMATVRYKVMTAHKRNPQKQGEIILRNVEMMPDILTVLKAEQEQQINIADANVIVSGGKGLKKASDLEMLTQLAGLLNGVVGASRPLVDDGWIGKEHQVGFSGNTVKPNIYIACGISGSPQHMAGMRNSDIIISINTDPSAPILRISDYGIVGDLYEIVPKIIETIKKTYQ